MAACVMKMGNLVLSNAVILAGEELEVTRGYLEIADGRVKKIAEGSPSGRAIDLKGGFVLPPFVNAHTHVADAVAKELYLGRAQPQVVGPGGLKSKALASSPPSEMGSATRATLRDMLQTGTLAHCDFREGGAAGVEVLRKNSAPPVKSLILGRISKIGELPKVLKKADGIGLPNIDAFAAGELGEISKRTLQMKKLLAVHVAETAGAQDGSTKRTGMSEVERAIELNCSFVVHGTHSSEDDLSELKKNDIPLVFCPRANGILGVGEPPIHAALDVGTEFFFGTDNAMVCQPNMFAELSFAWACLRRANVGVASEEARQLLKAATLEPIELFQLPWGPIAEGSRATFLVLSKGSNLSHLSDVYAGLVNRARADNIRAIYLDGKAVISQGKK